MKKNRVENFLQQHYNMYRDAGGDHAEYIVWNDIDDNHKLCRELRERYEESKRRAAEKTDYRRIRI